MAHIHTKKVGVGRTAMQEHGELCLFREVKLLLKVSAAPWENQLKGQLDQAQERLPKAPRPCQAHVSTHAQAVLWRIHGTSYTLELDLLWAEL